MFVFSRRSIQHCLDQLSEVLSADQLNNLVKRLNQTGKHRFATSWEPCILHSLGRLGTVSYESPLASRRKPDVSFIYPGESTIAFVADITAISDEGLHNANPFQYFLEELAKAARAAGLDPDHLRLEVRGRTCGPYGFEKTTLCLPPLAKIPDFLNVYVVPFLNEITERVLTHHGKIIKESDIDLTISYNINQQGMGGSYPAYDVRQSPKQNPLWNQLCKKTTQLVECAPLGIKAGIIVCDGGSTLFHRSAALGTVTPKEVVRQFFASHREISFVFLLAVDEINAYTSSNREFRLRAEFYSYQDNEEITRIRTTLADMVAGLPKPVLNSVNAYFRSREEGYGLGHFGGHTMSGRSVKISARELLDLLAGRRTILELNEAHGWGAGGARGRTMPSPFSRCLEEGRMIKRIDVVRATDEDDDWIAIEFGDPDPAIAPFVVKSRSSA